MDLCFALQSTENILTALFCYFFQLVLCIVMFLPEAKEKGFHLPPLSFILPFSVPAILYCLNNNIAVHMQLQMDPATYQVG